MAGAVMPKYGDIGRYHVESETFDVTAFGSPTKSYMVKRGGTVTFMAIARDAAIVIKSDVPHWKVGDDIGGIMSGVEWED